MLTPEQGRRRLRGFTVAAIVAATMLIPASAAMAMDTSTTEIEPTLAEMTPAQASLDELRLLVDDLSLANDVLQADNSSLHEALDQIASERDRLLDSLGRFDDLYAPLESDRQLLFELRKGVPETRPEAEAQLDRIRTLALTSDPSRLGQLLDRVEDAAPAFLDWRFGEFDSTQDFSTAYIDTGANAFDTSMEDFRSEVLMSVATRLDGLLTILDRVR
jgi:hypothetical protein